MNILMALSQLEITGAEVYAATLGNDLSERGHCLFFVSDTLNTKVLGDYTQLSFNRRSLLRRIWQVVRLVHLIQANKIQIVHAHSRAAAWSCRIACWLTRTPMVTTVHGRQPVHTSRRWFKAFGYRALAVCEAVRDQLIADLRVPPGAILVIRNGIDPNAFPKADHRPSFRGRKPRVAIVGRLTGPKGVLCKRLLSEALDLERWDVRVVTGSKIPSDFEIFRRSVTFIQDQSLLQQELAGVDLVIGAGRVAVEALFSGTPVYAVGETGLIGLVDVRNLKSAMATNFGDVGGAELDFDFARIRVDLLDLLGGHSEFPTVSSELREQVVSTYNLNDLVTKIEKVYQDAMVESLRREVPILMYHRFVAHPSEIGVHGTWVTVDMFEKHLRLIKRLGFETLTFKDIREKGFVHRFQPGKRYIMLTADDGYKDNLTRMLPLLKKYGMRATVFVVSGEAFNRWDSEHPTNPDIKIPLLSADEIRVLDSSGYVEIGGHTLSHAKLHELDSEAQAVEIRENKAALEKVLGRPILSFAYPFGYLNESAKEQARLAGYSYAVATDSGPRAMHQDPFQIRRIAVFPRTNVFGLWRKIRGNYVFRR